MSGARLTLDGVVKRFGGLAAVDGVSLDVSAGEFVGLIGPNGSGKTTLLNTIGGYYRPDGGRILLDARRLEGRSPAALARLGVGRTFQVTKLFRRLTVLENAVLPGLVSWRHGRAEVEHRARDVLRMLGLDAHAGARAATLSGGQGKLLEFARVMMLEPRLLLLDEPFGGVHPTLKRFMHERIVEWNAGGTTIVLVSHDMASVFGLCRRVVVMNTGRIIADGPPAAVRQDPEVIAAYLGEPHAA